MDIIQALIELDSKIQTNKAETQTPKLEKPKNYTKTQSVLHDMLTENTGIHMLDSGFYGRHWQFNRNIADFRQLEPVKCEIFGSYTKGEMPMISKSLFHVLDSELTYDSKMNKKFHRFANTKSQKDQNWLSVIKAFVKKYNEHDNYLEHYIIDNSYNHETCIDQGLQYAIFHNGDQDYCILQIHGGADIRGGYSDPKVFSFVNGWDYFLSSQTDLNASCGCEGLFPYSNNAGYYWSDNGNDNENNELPKVWHWSQRLNGLYCQDCKQKVRFS